MHALQQDMGREIICEKSAKKSEKRSRLRLQKDVIEVLQTHNVRPTHMIFLFERSGSKGNKLNVT